MTEIGGYFPTETQMNALQGRITAFEKTLEQELDQPEDRSREKLIRHDMNNLLTECFTQLPLTFPSREKPPLTQADFEKVGWKEAANEALADVEIALIFFQNKELAKNGVYEPDEKIIAGMFTKERAVQVQIGIRQDAEASDEEKVIESIESKRLISILRVLPAYVAYGHFVADPTMTNFQAVVGNSVSIQDIIIASGIEVQGKVPEKAEVTDLYAVALMTTLMNANRYKIPNTEITLTVDKNTNLVRVDNRSDHALPENFSQFGGIGPGGHTGYGGAVINESYKLTEMQELPIGNTQDEDGTWKISVPIPVI